MVTALVSCISMTPIQGGSLVHLWHHKEQQILIFPFWGRVQVEGTLEGGKILAISPYHLGLLAQSMLPEECP